MNQDELKALRRVMHSVSASLVLGTIGFLGLTPILAVFGFALGMNGLLLEHRLQLRNRHWQVLALIGTLISAAAIAHFFLRREG